MKIDPRDIKCICYDEKRSYMVFNNLTQIELTPEEYRKIDLGLLKYKEDSKFIQQKIDELINNFYKDYFIEL